MQTACQTSSVLVRAKQSARAAHTQFSAMSEIFEIEKEIGCIFYIGPRSSDLPLDKLATDLFHFKGPSYLLIVDYNSQFPVVRKLTSMMAHHKADHFKQIFAEYGWPDTLISDNGPCYTSKVFKGLMAEYHINHITSSPHYPQ